MSSNLKMALLAGAAGLALATGFGSPASAFDRSYWSFKLDIEPCVDIDVNLDPDSLTTVEIEQKSIGDITAISVVKDISIEQPQVGGDYGHDNGHDNDHNNNNGHDNDHNNPVPPLNALTELGSIVSAATAVANNVNIESVTEGNFADISQFAAGAYYSVGDVTAKSIVKSIDDLKIDSSATAVSNNINISVDPGSYIGDTSVVANLSQTSFMDVTAKSIVKDVTLTNFAGLGQLTTPVINSVATAVGNNVNIGVVVPTP